MSYEPYTARVLYDVTCARLSENPGPRGQPTVSTAAPLTPTFRSNALQTYADTALCVKNFGPALIEMTRITTCSLRSSRLSSARRVI